VHEAVLVEGMGTSLSLGFPVLVVVGEDEGLANDIFKHDQRLAIFVKERVLADKDILSDFWVGDPHVRHCLKIEGQERELFAIEALVGPVAQLAHEVVHRQPLLGPWGGLLPHVSLLVLDHVPHVPKEETLAAGVERCALLFIVAHSKHGADVKSHDYRQERKDADEGDFEKKPNQADE